MSENFEIKVNLEQDEIQKLKLIIKDLFDSQAIESSEIDDFIKFTLFIVFDEYNKNVESIRRFYKSNLPNYLESKEK